MNEPRRFEVWDINTNKLLGTFATRPELRQVTTLWSHMYPNRCEESFIIVDSASVGDEVVP